MYTYCSYHENQQNFLFHMDFTMVTSGTKFKLTPINSIPVVPTALSKNLAGPLSVSHLHGEPKSGYVSCLLNQRKVLFRGQTSLKQLCCTLTRFHNFPKPAVLLITTFKLKYQLHLCVIYRNNSFSIFTYML